MNLKNFSKVFLWYFLLLQQNGLALVQILGGKSTTIDKIPFMVQIYEKGEFICGGSLMSDYFVVTAAHCVADAEVNNFVVVGGATTLTGKGVVKSSIKKVFFHEEFDKSTLHMDVAVVKLKKGFINIPKAMDCKRNMKAGTVVEIFGWGVASKGDKDVSKNLRTGKFLMVDGAKCVKTSKGKSTKSVFCIKEYLKGVYPGDSGGPVLCSNCFCGIVSWFHDKDYGIHVSVFTNLAHVMPFINTIMKSM